MEKDKAKIVALSSHEAYMRLMFLATSLDNKEDEMIHDLKRNCLLVSAKISYEILYPIYNEFPEIKKDIALIETFFTFEKNKKPLKKIDTDEKARVIIYLATGAFNNLAGRLIPSVILSNEDDISKVVVEQSKMIILDILTPLFKKFPHFKDELDKIQDTFGVFPL